MNVRPKPKPCPSCGGTDLSWSTPYVLDDSSVIHLDMECENCGAVWTRIYEMVEDYTANPDPDQD